MGGFKYVLQSMQKLSGPQTIFHNHVFGSIARGHGDVKQLVTRPTAELSDQVLVKNAYLRNLAIEMMATKYVFNNTVINRLAIVDPSLPPYLRESMKFCFPPHATIDHNSSLDYATCRQSVLCPNCRMRVQEKILRRLKPYIGTVRYIAVLRISMRGATGRVPSVSSNLKLRDVFNKIYQRRWNNWPYDAVIALPRYAPKYSEWVTVGAIIALVTDKKQLWDPVTKLGRNLEWSIHSASESRLVKVIAETTNYQARMMYSTEFTDNELVQLRIAYAGAEGDRPPFRLRFHGMTKPKKAMKPITIIRQESTITTMEILNDVRTEQEHNQYDLGWGLTYAPADLEQSPGYPG